MSRIGKQIINIPEKTEVINLGGKVTVKGPLGEMSRVFKDDITILTDGKTVSLSPKEKDIQTNALWGTYAAHLKNMIAGVNKLFVKKLVIEGVGYKAEISGQELVLSLGFSHKIKVPIPKELKVTVEKSVVTISSIDKELVGQFSAKIRDYKRPEPYKGKGIMYEKEIVRRKQGKKSV
ncbi:MAG: 50S ribosomal protein L6 [Patescibacteria group bacterium]